MPFTGKACALLSSCFANALHAQDCFRTRQRGSPALRTDSNKALLIPASLDARSSHRPAVFPPSALPQTNAQAHHDPNTSHSHPELRNQQHHLFSRDLTSRSHSHSQCLSCSQSRSALLVSCDEPAPPNHRQQQLQHRVPSKERQQSLLRAAAGQQSQPISPVAHQSSGRAGGASGRLLPPVSSTSGLLPLPSHSGHSAIQLYSGAALLASGAMDGGPHVCVDIAEQARLLDASARHHPPLATMTPIDNDISHHSQQPHQAILLLLEQEWPGGPLAPLATQAAVHAAPVVAGHGGAVAPPLRHVRTATLPYPAADGGPSSCSAVPRDCWQQAPVVSPQPAAACHPAPPGAAVAAARQANHNRPNSCAFDPLGTGVGSTSAANTLLGGTGGYHTMEDLLLNSGAGGGALATSVLAVTLGRNLDVARSLSIRRLHLPASAIGTPRSGIMARSAFGAVAPAAVGGGGSSAVAAGGSVGSGIGPGVGPGVASRRLSMMDWRPGGGMLGAAMGPAAGPARTLRSQVSSACGHAASFDAPPAAVDLQQARSWAPPFHQQQQHPHALSLSQRLPSRRSIGVVSGSGNVRPGSGHSATFVTVGGPPPHHYLQHHHPQHHYQQHHYQQQQQHSPTPASWHTGLNPSSTAAGGAMHQWPRSGAPTSLLPPPLAPQMAHSKRRAGSTSMIVRSFAAAGMDGGSTSAAERPLQQQQQQQQQQPLLAPIQLSTALQVQVVGAAAAAAAVGVASSGAGSANHDHQSVPAGTAEPPSPCPAAVSHAQANAEVAASILAERIGSEGHGGGFHTTSGDVLTVEMLSSNLDGEEGRAAAHAAGLMTTEDHGSLGMGLSVTSGGVVGTRDRSYGGSGQQVPHPGSAAAELLQAVRASSGGGIALAAALTRAGSHNGSSRGSPAAEMQALLCGAGSAAAGVVGGAGGASAAAAAAGGAYPPRARRLSRLSDSPSSYLMPAAAASEGAAEGCQRQQQPQQPHAELLLPPPSRSYPPPKPAPGTPGPREPQRQHPRQDMGALPPSPPLPPLPQMPQPQSQPRFASPPQQSPAARPVGLISPMSGLERRQGLSRVASDKITSSILPSGTSAYCGDGIVLNDTEAAAAARCSSNAASTTTATDCCTQQLGSTVASRTSGVFSQISSLDGAPMMMLGQTYPALADEFGRSRSGQHEGVPLEQERSRSIPTTAAEGRGSQQQQRQQQRASRAANPVADAFPPSPFTSSMGVSSVLAAAAPPLRQQHQQHQHQHQQQPPQQHQQQQQQPPQPAQRVLDMAELRASGRGLDAVIPADAADGGGGFGAAGSTRRRQQQQQQQQQQAAAEGMQLWGGSDDGAGKSGEAGAMGADPFASSQGSGGLQLAVGRAYPSGGASSVGASKATPYPELSLTLRSGEAARQVLDTSGTSGGLSAAGIYFADAPSARAAERSRSTDIGGGAPTARAPGVASTSAAAGASAGTHVAGLATECGGYSSDGIVHFQPGGRAIQVSINTAGGGAGPDAAAEAVVAAGEDPPPPPPDMDRAGGNGLVGSSGVGAGVGVSASDVSAAAVAESATGGGGAGDSTGGFMRTTLTLAATSHTTNAGSGAAAAAGGGGTAGGFAAGAEIDSLMDTSLLATLGVMHNGASSGMRESRLLQGLPVGAAAAAGASAGDEVKWGSGGGIGGSRGGGGGALASARGSLTLTPGRVGGSCSPVPTTLYGPGSLPECRTPFIGVPRPSAAGMVLAQASCSDTDPGSPGSGALKNTGAPAAAAAAVAVPSPHGSSPWGPRMPLAAVSCLEPYSSSSLEAPRSLSPLAAPCDPAAAASAAAASSSALAALAAQPFAPLVNVGSTVSAAGTPGGGMELRLPAPPPFAGAYLAGTNYGGSRQHTCSSPLQPQPQHQHHYNQYLQQQQQQQPSQANPQHPQQVLQQALHQALNQRRQQRPPSQASATLPLPTSAVLAAFGSTTTASAALGGALCSTATAAGHAAAAPPAYHRITATRCVDPVSGREAVVVVQDDVSAKVVVERHLALRFETEHRLLEQIFPNHILRALTDEAVMAQEEHERVVEALAAAQGADVDHLLSKSLPLSPRGGTAVGGSRRSSLVSASAAATVAALRRIQNTNNTSTNNNTNYKTNTNSTSLHGEPSAHGCVAGSTSPLPGAMSAAHVAAPRVLSVSSRLSGLGTAAAGVATSGRRRVSSVSGAMSLRPAVREGCNALATFHPCVTLLFADIKGFTPMCRQVEPHAVMTMLNDLFSRFDSQLDKYGVRKVETIGDAYFVAGGLTFEDSLDQDPQAAAAAAAAGVGVGEEDGPIAAAAASLHTSRRGGGRSGEECRLHAARVIGFAKAMLEAARHVPLPTKPSEPVQIRVGIHTGPCVSGVVGNKMPRFCLFGAAVSTAARLESSGEAGALHVSATTWRLLPEEEQRAGGWEPRQGGVQVRDTLHQSYLWRQQ